MDDKLKQAIFGLGASHSSLAQAEYNRNQGYNNEHFSHKAEESFIQALTENGLIKEFMDYMGDNDGCA